jgi:hypothetical protein
MRFRVTIQASTSNQSRERCLTLEASDLQEAHETMRELIKFFAKPGRDFDYKVKEALTEETPKSLPLVTPGGNPW